MTMSTDIAYPEGRVEWIVNHFRDQILRGELSAGDPINEVEVSEKLAISRTPVREAIARMVARGLFEKQQGRTARVRRHTLNELLEVYELRVLLEGAAAARAAETISADDRTRLSDLASLLDSAENDEWLDLHREFHSLIISAADRPRMESILSDLRAQSEIYIWVGRLDTNRYASAQREHVELAEAIVRGDGLAAQAVMHQHLEGTVASVTRIAHAANGLIIPLD